MDWLKRLFGILDKTSDRVEAAGERIASAAEDIADQWEAMRDRNRERLGVEKPLAVETNGRKTVAKLWRNGDKE